LGRYRIDVPIAYTGMHGNSAQLSHRQQTQISFVGKKIPAGQHHQFAKMFRR